MNIPIPQNESARLKDLYSYEILDTLPEQAFDDFILLVTQICQTPIAHISLVDSDRQWFKAACGIDATETPREHSFCSRTIMEHEVLIVRDATLDERFKDNPYVIGEPKIRFYAGTPLISPQGHALGALCAVDQVPRELSEKQIEALRALSRQIVAQMELRKAIKTIRLLKQMVPICASCKKIRDDEGFWSTVEQYLVENTGVKLSHGLCPTCYDDAMETARLEAERDEKTRKNSNHKTKTR